MRSHNNLLVLALIGAILFGTGCAGGLSPLTPVDQPAGTAQAGYRGTGNLLWGIWDVNIDTSTGTADVVPLRGTMFTANVNNLLENKPGNLLIQDLDLTDYMSEGRVDCTITLRHPLPGLDMYHGFDVRGVFMHNGSKSLNYEGVTYGDPKSDSDAVLLNADGYTRWFNYPEFDGNGAPILEFYPGKLSDLQNPSAILNGFKIFADGLDAEDFFCTWILAGPNAESRGIFGAGQVNSRRYEMKFPMPGGSPLLHFQYAVVATWEPGDPTLTGSPALYDPFDFPSSANCDEAFAIRTYTDGSTLFNDGAGQSGGTFAAAFEIFDWQGGIVSELGVPYEIERIVLEGEFLPGGSHEWSQSELVAIAEPGSTVCSVFQVEIAGCTPDAVEEEEFWVIVESAGINGESYGQGFPTEYPDGVRAAFQKGNVIVSNQASGLTVTSIDPDTVPFWGSVDDAEVQGSGFVDGCSVELRKDAEIVAASEVIFINEGVLHVDLDMAGADSGVWDVVVINPDLQEGILEDGFTIDVWSEEITIDQGGNRLPQMCETSAGSAVLLFGCNDSTFRYAPFEEGIGFGALDTAVVGDPGHWLMVMTEDPVNDYVYLASNLENYRYTGAPGLWDHEPSGWGSANAGAICTDIDGKLHLFQNTLNAFGHINHSRKSGWAGSMEIYYDNVMDGWNINVISDGNIITQSSNGTIYMVYERDWWLNQYGQQQPGPRWVKVCWVPLGGLVSYNYANIDTANNMDPLDSPSIDCDSNDILHAAYRRWIASTSMWQVVYKKSTNAGPSWGSESVVHQGAAEIEDGYVYIQCDANDALHVIYNVDGDILYKFSENGTSWSDAETANPSASELPPNITDVTPRELVTSDGIMHVLWIRRDVSGQYGDVMHRMRDLL